MSVPGSLTTFLHHAQLPRRYRVTMLLGLLTIAISRATYPLLHGRFYAEEGSIYFAHMYSGGPWFVARTVGYIYAFCNMSTWFAARSPIEYAPLVTAWLSLAVVVTVVWAALSLPSRLLPNAGSQIAAATLLVVGPLASPVAWLNTTNAQVYLGVLAVLFLFVELQRLRRATVVAVGALLALAGLSGLYAAILSPLFVFRAVRERTRRQIFLAGVVSLCALAQLVVVLNSSASGDLAAGRGTFRGLGVMTRDVAAGHLSTFLFGSTITSRLHAHAFSSVGLLGFSLFAVVLAVVLAFVLAFVPRPEVSFLLVAAFALVEGLILFGTRGTTTGRYAVVPIAILILIVVHGTTGRSRPAAGVAVALCLVTFVAGASEFWKRHPTYSCRNCPRWSHEVRAWQSGASDRLAIWPYAGKSRWFVKLPHQRPEQALAEPRPAGDAHPKAA